MKLCSSSAGYQLPLKGISRRRKTLAPKISEAGVQGGIVEALRLYGLTVLTTDRHRKRVRCDGCGAWSWQAGGDGVTPGVPDLLVRRVYGSRHGPPWPENAWLGLEVKGPTTAVSLAQRELAAAGAIVVVKNHDEALAAVAAFEDVMRAFL